MKSVTLRWHAAHVENRHLKLQILFLKPECLLTPYCLGGCVQLTMYCHLTKQVLELDSNYCPTMSSYKVCLVDMSCPDTSDLQH